MSTYFYDFSILLPPVALDSLLVATGVVLAYFFSFFIVGTLIKRNDIVDIGWGLGFFVTALALLAIQLYRYQRISDLSIIVVLMVGLWGLRLALHILMRNKGEKEDFRYANWRKEWGKWVVPRAFFQVYMLQGLFMLTIGFGVFMTASLGESLIGQWQSLDLYLVLGGLIIWALGYTFEVVGDRQLKRFKSNPNNRGKIMTSGLWQYTRHPNYFGEATLWWGFSLIALVASRSWLVFISPIVITYLLVFVSGVPMLEKKYEGRQDFEAYKSSTSAFIPWFKK